MEYKVEIIDLSTGLDDSELESYRYDAKKNILRVYIRAWNDVLLEFIFDDVLHFVDNGSAEMKNFCKVTGNASLLKNILEFNFRDGKVPKDHPYRYFQFYDVDDNPCMEIICIGFEYFEKSKQMGVSGEI